jgi:hypothetical protein
VSEKILEYLWTGGFLLLNGFLPFLVGSPPPLKSPIVIYLTYQKKRKKKKIWVKKCSGEKNGEENEKIKNNKVILKIYI